MQLNRKTAFWKPKPKFKELKQFYSIIIFLFCETSAQHIALIEKFNAEVKFATDIT